MEEGLKRSVVRRATACAVVVLCAALLWSETGQANVDRPEVEEVADRCSDPLTGVWQAHHHYDGSWYRLTLEVDREDARSGRLEGRILSRFWPGRLEDGPAPRECDGFQDVEVQMPSAGQYKEGQFVFLGDKGWSVGQVMCGGYQGNYVPDGFFGELMDEGRTLKANWLGIRSPETVQYEGNWRGDGSNYLVGEGLLFERMRCAQKSALPIPQEPQLEEQKSASQPAAPARYNTGCMGLF